MVYGLVFLWAFWSAANAVEPSGWERRILLGTPVSVLVPKGSAPQKMERHPGFDEAAAGWMLQSLRWPHRGASRMILYLKRGDITVYYSRNNPDRTFRTLDDYVRYETNGRSPEAEQYGKWQGYTVRLVALKNPNRHPPAEAPFGDLAVHAVEFGPREYLAVSLHAHPDAMEDYLRYFFKVRDSIRYTRPKPIIAAKEPLAAPAPQQQKKKLVLLPSLFPRNRFGHRFYPYVRVLRCPEHTMPVPSNWPRPGSYLCRPVTIHGES